MPTDIYLVLKDRMDKQGLSWQTLADRIQMSKDGLFKAFKARSLKFETVMSLCEALQMHPWEIWEDEMVEKRIIAEARHAYGDNLSIELKLKLIENLAKELRQEITKK